MFHDASAPKTKSLLDVPNFISYGSALISVAHTHRNIVHSNAAFVVREIGSNARLEKHEKYGDADSYCVPAGFTLTLHPRREDNEPGNYAPLAKRNKGILYVNEEFMMNEMVRRATKDNSNENIDRHSVVEQETRCAIIRREQWEVSCNTSNMNTHNNATQNRMLYAVVWIQCGGSTEPSIVFCSGHSALDEAMYHAQTKIFPLIPGGSKIVVAKCGEWISCSKMAFTKEKKEEEYTPIEIESGVNTDTPLNENDTSGYMGRLEHLIDEDGA